MGFALTALQRRLASSPEAIYQSLKRRHQKLRRRVEEEKRNPRTQLQALPIAAGPIPENIWESSDELSAEVFERFEEELVDKATAARTIQELEAEILILQDLEEQARQVVHSGVDRKWEELSNLLHNTPEMHDPEGRQRKLIIFTEHRDTLHYLTDRIRGLLGSTEAVETIHGGITREDRRDVQARFRNDPTVRVLLATDAAGEGVNLQTASLMVNYDLPWNPTALNSALGAFTHRADGGLPPLEHGGAGHP